MKMYHTYTTSTWFLLVFWLLVSEVIPLKLSCCAASFVGNHGWCKIFRYSFRHIYVEHRTNCRLLAG